MTDGQIILILAWLVIMITIIWIAIVIMRRKQQRVESAWREFAHQRGYRWIEASGPWYRKQSFSAAGTVDGVSVTLDRHSVQAGKHRIVYTRLRGTLARGLQGRLTVRTRNFSNRLNDLFVFGPPAVETGHTEFDARMIVRAQSQESARLLLDEEARKCLLAFARPLRIECEGREATLLWRREELDPARLEAGCELIAALCKDR